MLVTKRLPPRWRYALGGLVLSGLLIVIFLPVVDEFDGFNNLPDWVRNIAMIFLLIVDFPSIFSMIFYGGFMWPETLPTFLCPTEPREFFIIGLFHLPSLLFWFGIGFQLGKSKESRRSQQSLDP
jgi:hypothetical protein